VNEADLVCLKSNIGKILEVETIDGARHHVRVVSVFDAEDDPDMFYELVSTSRPDLYPRITEKCGYSLPLGNIVSVKTAEGGPAGADLILGGLRSPVRKGSFTKVEPRRRASFECLRASG
jgi:hypothetical protein